MNIVNPLCINSRHFRVAKKPFIGAAVACSFALLSATVSAPASASTPDMMSDEHSTANVDISQPIAALDKLDSLKQVEPLKMAMPEFQRFTTSNGIPVIFFQTNQLPIVDVEIRFNAGSARDGSIGNDSFGLANMVAKMLTKGTADLNETDYAETTEQLGIELGASAYKDQFIVSLRSLSDTKNLYPALSLMSDIMTAPKFDAEVLARNKAQQLLALKQMQQNPSFIASTTLSNVLYGNHPYAHSPYGTVDSVSTLSRDDLKQFQQRYLVAKNATLSITGDLSLKQAKNVAEKATKALKLGQPAAKLPTPKPVTQSQWVHVDYDSDQTSIAMGQIGYALKSEDSALQKHAAFIIGNDILAGGGFNSRLMGKVRKELGYTYGIYGNMSPMQVAGPYAIKFSTRNDKADEAIAATLTTIDNTLANGVTEDEFTLTQESLINSFPMGFASNAGINRMLGFLNFNSLPNRYVSGYVDRIENTTINTVNDVLKDTIDPNKFIIVTVGKPEIAETSPLNTLKTHESFH